MCQTVCTLDNSKSPTCFGMSCDHFEGVQSAAEAGMPKHVADLLTSEV
jgi:hypothetical protein